MHAGAFFNPHHPQLLLGLLVAVVALLVMAAAAPELGSIELPFVGDDGGAASVTDTTTSGSWTTEPLAAPVDLLRQR